MGNFPSIVLLSHCESQIKMIFQQSRIRNENMGSNDEIINSKQRN